MSYINNVRFNANSEPSIFSRASESSNNIEPSIFSKAHKSSNNIERSIYYKPMKVPERSIFPPRQRHNRIPCDYGATPPSNLKTIYNIPSKSERVPKSHLYYTYDNYGASPSCDIQTIPTYHRTGNGYIAENPFG
jgi:hypothetical protein